MILPKIIFLDIDGTTWYNKEQRMVPSTVKALSILKDKGVKLFVCTSRALEETCMLPESYMELFDGFIVAAGSMVYVDGQCIHKAVIDLEQTQQVIADLDKHNRVYRWQSEDEKCYLNRIDESKMGIFHYLYNYVPAVKPYDGSSLCHLLFYIDEPDGMKTIEPISTKMNIIHLGGTKEATKMGVTKAYGMKVVADYYQTTLEDTAAFGDGHNDIEMLSVAGVGVAMGNGCDEAKAHANYVTTDILEDGVYNACCHFNWI